MEMEPKAVTKIMLTLILTSMITTAFDIAYTANELSIHNIDTDLHYETIQGAIDAPETLDGHTIRVDTGIYSEHLTVSKSLKLVGEDRSTTIIDGGGTGTVINVTANNVDIGGFTLRNSGPYFEDKGIILDHSSNTVIGGNTITNNMWGIWLEYAVETVISEDTIQNSTFGSIYLGNSTNNNISNNTITNNKYGMWLERSSKNNGINVNAITDNWKGICLAKTANNNTICSNNIADNEDGILLSSSFNSIYENTITNNSFGIYSLYSRSNTIYHNNFIENIKQASLNESCVNAWDNGYEGNYWSDYTGEDSDGDGIGDTHQIINANNTDRYPLMVQYVAPEDTTPPNIAVLSPENKTYTANDVSLIFTVSESTSWTRYSLDEQGNLTISGNTTLSDLSDGLHTLIAYAKDTAGNLGASEMIYFSIETLEPVPFPIFVVAAIVTAVIFGAALLAYFMKDKKKTE